MARLDRLGPSREVAQIGSVIGRGFSYGLLRDVAGMEDAALQAALEKLAEADIVLVQGLPPESDYRFKHALIQDAAYENLLKSRRQVLHRRVAENCRDRFADTAAAEPEALAYHFTQAGMTDAAIEWWGRAGDQALRRSAFQEAISHLGRAIEMADKLAQAAPAEAPRRGGRVRLQTAYGNALLAARGHGAPETTAAFTRAAELAAGAEDTAERFSARYGLWTGSYVRGELESMRELSAAFLRDAERAPDSRKSWSDIASLASPILSTVITSVRGRISSRRSRPMMPSGTVFSPSSTAWTRAFPARSILPTRCGRSVTSRAHRLADEALADAERTGHLATVAYAFGHVCELDLVCRHTGRLLQHAQSLAALSREHGLQMWLAFGTFELGYARWRTGERDAGDADMRLGMGMLREQAILVRRTLFESQLAEAEAEMGHIDAALRMLDDALAKVQQSGQWNLAELHRIRGEILLKRDPANTVPAEEAFLTAIAVAQQQKARSFELRAALSLAKLYQSAGRAADAHAVLAPALEGFSLTPEFPEIEQAQTLLAVLAATEEVKNATASRQRRLKLQTSYGQAMMHVHGHGAPETTAAFARAAELAARAEDATEHFSARYGLWTSSYVRGERTTRELAMAFLRDAECVPNSPEVLVGHRIVGISLRSEGDYIGAREQLEQALSSYDAELHGPLAFRYGVDSRVSCMVYLALTLWPLGDVTRALLLADEAVASAQKTGHVATLAYALGHVCSLDLLRRDAETSSDARQIVGRLEPRARVANVALPSALSNSAMHAGARASVKPGKRKCLRDSGRCREQELALELQLLEAAYAEAQSEMGPVESAVAILDGAFALSERTGQRWHDAELNRLRGNILLKRDPANTAPAEEAFLAAGAVAREQKARSFELRAALSLAKLYQSTGRAADAHAVLAPALEGFSLTPEFPEIEQAQTLLAVLAETEEVKNAKVSRR